MSGPSTSNRVRASFAIIALLCAVKGLSGQDRRTVTEPSIPPACVTLNAQLTSRHGSLADADEPKLDTARIQHALDVCPKGQSVALRSSGSADAFISGPLELRAGVTLLVDRGVTLFESVDPKVLETSPGSCGVVSDAPGRGCRPLLAVDNVAGAAVMGEGIIDGRGGVKLVGKNASAWDLAEQARPGGGQKVSRLIVANHADDFTLYRITLRNSPNFHVVYNGGHGFTVWGVTIDTPGKGARNTDGIDPGNGARDITVTHSFISTGDDDIAIKGGPGGVTDMTVSHNHFYRGHGMSIGSETNGGVSRIRVSDLTLDGPDNGLRIKSNAARGGLVHDVVYEDICIRNSPNPIYLDTAYSANGSMEGTLYPTFEDITFRNVTLLGGGKISFNGFPKDHRVGVTLDGVTVADTAKYRYSVSHADFRLGPGPVNLQLAGEDVTKSGTPATGSPALGAGRCSGRSLELPRASDH